jgi:hypothetical protein
MKKVFYVIAAAFLSLYILSCTDDQDETIYEFGTEEVDVQDEELQSIENEEVKDSDI